MLLKLFDMGVMPNLKSLSDEGTLLRMETSQPPVSSVAWTSFMTGSNPADHGIFGFTDVEKHRISLKLPSFDDVLCPTIWTRHQEKRALIINLPFTYPARPLNGKLICGFVAPIFERAVYPETLIPWLKSQNYKIDTDNIRARGDRNFLIKDLFDNLNCLRQVSLHLVREYWDMLILVITGTDRLHHFLYDAFEEKDHTFHSDFISYYGMIDSFIQSIVGLMGQSVLKVFLSDHGFACLETQIYLNTILKSLGYLKFTRNDPKSLEDIHPDSLAFAMDPTRIYLNTLDRFGNFLMPQSRAQETVARLKQDLQKLTISDVGLTGPEWSGRMNNKLFLEVRQRDEAYSGRHLNLAPDLVVIPNRGFDVKATINATTMSSKDIFTGMHTHDDAFVLISDPDWSNRMERACIENVAQLVPWTTNTLIA